MKLLIVGVAAYFFTACSFASSVVLKQNSVKVFERIKQSNAAIANRGDKDSFTKLLNSLERYGNYWIYEGVLMSADEIRVDLEKSRQGSTSRFSTNSLAVNVYNGKPDYLRTIQSRNLVFRIVQESFPSREEYEATAEYFKQAAKDWQDICDSCQITFTGLEPDGNDILSLPANSKEFLIEHDSSINTLVTSFFPSTPADRRKIILGRDYFELGLKKPVDPIGVMRHAIGHVLGYRHARSIGGDECLNKSLQTSKRAVQNYDAGSVMRYARCDNLKISSEKFSEADIRAHRELYGLGSIDIIVDGKNIPTTVANILSGFLKIKGLLYMKHIQAPRGKSLCDIYYDHLNLPRGTEDDKTDSCTAINALAKQINRKSRYSFSPFSKQIRVPIVTGKLSTYQKSFYKWEEKKLSQWEQKRVFKSVKTPSKLKRTRVLETVEWSEYRLLVSISNQQLAGGIDNLEKQLYGFNFGDGVSIDLSQVRSKRDYYQTTLVSPKEYVEKCQTANDAGFQGDYFMHSSGEIQSEYHNNPARCSLSGDYKCGAEGLECPVVALIDKPIKLNNEFIKERIRGGGVSAPQAALTESANCPAMGNTISDTLSSDEHGTHLAGIIIGGRHFKGTGDGADHLYSIDVNIRRNDLRAEILGKANSVENNNPLVFVIASRFEYSGRKNNDFGNYIDPRDGFSLDPEGENRLAWEHAIRDQNHANPVKNMPQAGAIVKASNHPFIVAIGDPKVDRDRPVRIDAQSAASPMNLANKSNVILVTACIECEKGEYALLPDTVNVGVDDFRPHVAAPGGYDEPMISTAGFNGMSRAKGTSQSAAFVGGLTATMTACWPDIYSHNPFIVKRRLQVTAKPMVSKSQANIRSGVVDVDAALLDPTKEYVNFDQTDRNDISWCAEKAVAVLKDGNEITIPFNKVHRIKRIKDQNNNALYTNSWIVYLQGGDIGDAVVEKIGPISFFTKVDTDLIELDSLIKLQGAETGLPFINDILLSEPINQVESCASNAVALLNQQ